MSQNGTIESPLYNDRQAAKYVRVSPRTLWTMRKEGKIRATVIGRKVFYRRENLDRFIAECENGGPTDGK
jgi:excisionase family DNA binding protein